jgi:putative salt-induced outer membrane protein
LRHPLIALAAVLAIAAPPALGADDKGPPPQTWVGSLGAGLSFTGGNSSTAGVNLAFDAKYLFSEKSFLKVNAFWIYQSTDGTSTVDKDQAAARYEAGLSDRVYAFGEVAYLRDVFKNVTYLVAPQVGAGYRFVKTKDIILSADAGIGWAFEKNPNYDAKNSGAVSLSQSFSYALGPGTLFNEKVGGLWKMNDYSDYNIHFEAGVATSFSRRSELKVTYILDYKNMPTGGALRSDSTVLLTIVFKL